MSAIQLDLWSGAVLTAPSTLEESAAHQPAAFTPADPCKECELKGLCPSDDCGAHLFPLDVPTIDYMSEDDYMQMLFRNALI